MKSTSMEPEVLIKWVPINVITDRVISGIILLQSGGFRKYPTDEEELARSVTFKTGLI
jgi:hypothetical protein